MNVKLISITKPLIDNVNNAEELVTYCARVSNPSNQLNTGTAPKLLKYLIEHKHFSPFEMVDMTVEIKTSRAIAAQILRHRSFSFQEFSQRYAKVTEMEPIELRKKGSTNRQSSTEVFDPNIVMGAPVERFEVEAGNAIQLHIEQTQYLYNSLIDADVAPEVARMVLPLTTQTTIYMKGSLRSWIHYLQIRCDEHVQKEHRDVADLIKQIFKEQFPNISEALEF
jgi:thymidylate synthase (FAD)